MSDQYCDGLGLCLKGFAATPALREQKPVAWAYQFDDERPIYFPTKRDWAVSHPHWTETPLYAAPPAEYEAGAAAAQTQIVAWLRSNPGWPDAPFGMLGGIANCIEVGDYREPEA